MDLKEINQYLSDFNKIKRLPSAGVVGEVTEYEHHEKIYKLNDEVYFAMIYYKDSYGGEELTGVKLVKPKVVQVTEYEEF